MHCWEIIPNCPAYLYFNELDADREGIFTAHLKNANTKKAVHFLTLLKNKQYFVTNIRVKTRTERDITKFQNFNNFINKQSDLCKNAIRFDAKIPPLFDTIWERCMNILMQTL